MVKDERSPNLKHQKALKEEANKAKLTTTTTADMGYYGNEGGYPCNGRRASFFDGFTLNPLPYPVLLILAVISIFLGIKWFSDFEEAVESAEDSTNWALLAAPILLLLAVRWISSLEDPGSLLFGFFPSDRRRQSYHQCPPQGGSSPWGVAALIVLLLVLLQFQSSFLDSWSM